MMPKFEISDPNREVMKVITINDSEIGTEMYPQRAEFLKGWLQSAWPDLVEIVLEDYFSSNGNAPSSAQQKSISEYINGLFSNPESKG